MLFRKHTFIVSVLALALISLKLILPFFSSHDLSFSPLSSHALEPCFSTPVHTLQSMDPFVFTAHAHGWRQNDFETRFQEHVWDTLINNTFFPARSDMSFNMARYGHALLTDHSDLRRLAMMSHGMYHNRIASPIQINYVHHRLDRFRGLQFVVNFEIDSNDQKDKMRQFTLFVQRSWESSLCHVALSQSSNTDQVYILIPYHARPQRLRLLFANFLYIRRALRERIILIVSVVSGLVSDERDVHEAKAIVFGHYDEEATSVWLHRYRGDNDGDKNMTFSRAIALRESAKLIKSDNAIIFQCDVDMHVLPDFIHRCRHNTKLGVQVYFPVFYSLFPYGNRKPAIFQRNGFWRTTSFGMACMRKGDFDDIAAFDDAESRFHGWGGEDVFQFERVRNSTRLIAVRAVDPALIHRWHSKACDALSEGYVDCMNTNFMTMGHPLRIGPALLKSVTSIDGFFKYLENS